MKSGNKFRAARIALYLLFLSLLILYGYYFHPHVTLQMCLADPQKYTGSRIEVGNEALVHEIFKDGFSIKQQNRIVPVHGMSADVKINEFVIIDATFHELGWLEAHRIRVAKKRRYKIVLSVLPVLFILILFFKRYRFDFHNLYFIERKPCRT